MWGQFFSGIGGFCALLSYVTGTFMKHPRRKYEQHHNFRRDNRRTGTVLNSLCNAIGQCHQYHEREGCVASSLSVLTVSVIGLSFVNSKNRSLSMVLTATDQKPQKIIKN